MLGRPVRPERGDDVPQLGEVVAHRGRHQLAVAGEGGGVEVGKVDGSEVEERVRAGHRELDPTGIAGCWDRLELGLDHKAQAPLAALKAL